ncbi:MAG: ribonuclease P protein component [Betaproteobacteria bacterium]|nr:ribonuclease P protein component [Betaproteobacteria bacterium]
MAPQARLERLTQRQEFAAVLAHGRISAGRYFVVRARPSGLSFARLGVIAGRKPIRRAVDRNRCKRIVREVFRERKESLAMLDVVVMCRAAVPRKEAAGARRELGRLLVAVSADRGPPPAIRTRQ